MFSRRGLAAVRVRMKTRRGAPAAKRVFPEGQNHHERFKCPADGLGGDRQTSPRVRCHLVCVGKSRPGRRASRSQSSSGKVKLKRQRSLSYEILEKLCVGVVGGGFGDGRPAI